MLQRRSPVLPCSLLNKVECYIFWGISHDVWLRSSRVSCKQLLIAEVFMHKGSTDYSFIAWMKQEMNYPWNSFSVLHLHYSCCVRGCCCCWCRYEDRDDVCHRWRALDSWLALLVRDVSLSDIIASNNADLTQCSRPLQHACWDYNANILALHLMNSQTSIYCLL